VRPSLPGGRALPAPRPHCQTARTAAAVKQRQPHHQQQKRLARRDRPSRRCLIRRRRPRYPATRVHLTHGTCRGAEFSLVCASS
jgi:hypothetical protein